MRFNFRKILARRSNPFRGWFFPGAVATEHRECYFDQILWQWILDWALEGLLDETPKKAAIFCDKFFQEIALLDRPLRFQF